MRTLIVGLGTVGMLTAATVALAGTAAAAPMGGGSAPLSECTVTGVSGLSGSNAADNSLVSRDSTVYVGVDCNDDHDE
jgi:hypothetical protein